MSLLLSTTISKRANISMQNVLQDDSTLRILKKRNYQILQEGLMQLSMILLLKSSKNLKRIYKKKFRTFY